MKYLRIVALVFVCILISVSFGETEPYNNPSTSDIIKLDSFATDGLAGTSNSLAYRIHEIEKHFHSPERWVGIQAPQTGTDWADDTLTPFVAISGSNTYGADADDEALVLGTDDTPIISGMVKYDLHRLLIVDVDHDTPYKIRIVYGSGTMADAVSAGQYSEVIVKFDAANPTTSAGSPIEVMMPRRTCGTDKLWIQAWNATDNSQIDFLVGLHEYEG